MPRGAAQAVLFDEPTDLLSLRVPLSVARDFRTEAARRGKRQNTLFEEMWQAYLQSQAR
jgi:hypothetical protein